MTKTFKAGDKVRYQTGKGSGWEGCEGTVIQSDEFGTHVTLTKSGNRDGVRGHRYHLTTRKLELVEPDAFQIAFLAHPSNGKSEDVVNNPSHYTQYPVEVIELTRHMNFCRGNAVKYIARAGHKDPAKEIEDLKKAVWYIQDEIAQLEEAK